MLTWDTTVQPAIAQQWNLTVQHEIASNTTVQVGYVGQHTTHLMVPDAEARCPAPDGTVLALTSVVRTCGVHGPRTSAPTFGPNDFGIVKTLLPYGSMNYNALQAVLQKRFSNGLQTQVSYTYQNA